jgi:hypothetical protein
MHSMVYRGPYKVRVEGKDIPPIEHPNDAIVRVKLAAICGSDLHLYSGRMPDTRVGMVRTSTRPTGPPTPASSPASRPVRTLGSRERSIEHAFVTPVFGTSTPPKGASGALRKYAYWKYSEGRAAHWLVLIAADRWTPGNTTCAPLPPCVGTTR